VIQCSSRVVVCTLLLRARLCLATSPQARKKIHTGISAFFTQAGRGDAGAAIDSVAEDLLKDGEAADVPPGR
jgi:hypothetical protein